MVGTSSDEQVRASANYSGSERTAFTPGPWRVDPHSLWIMADGVEKGPMHVADARGWGYLTGKGHGALGLGHDAASAIMEANASLIAAAPDMYAALEKIVAESWFWAIDYDESGQPKPEKIRRLDERGEIAVAALSKAHGTPIKD